MVAPPPVDPKERAKWANPACLRCDGSGWDVLEKDECRCVARSLNEPLVLNVRDVLSRRSKEDLEAKLRRILIRAKGVSAVHDARTLASFVARGAAPPSVEKLAAFAKVDTAAADEMMTEIRAALAGTQTKKKGKIQ